MRQRDFFTEYTLMSLAAIGAFYIGEYPEGVAVMLFYSIGEALQERAVERARRNIRALVDIRPEQANVLVEGKPVAMPAAQVVPGRTIEVLPGGRVPLDGVLLSEAAPFNTAALTGESTPRTIRKGEEVLAGMISSLQPVRIEVTRPYGESALSRILSMVEEAAARKAPAELFIRRFARIYTPVVTGLAVLIVALPGLWSLLHGGFAYSFDDGCPGLWYFWWPLVLVRWLSVFRWAISAVSALLRRPACSLRAVAIWMPLRGSIPWFSTRPAR